MTATTPSALAGIAVRVETATGNVLPILHEIRHALARLIATGESAAIDLRAIPLAPGEEERILDLLGRGEVSASFDSLGRTDICETQYAGCWTVTHCDPQGAVAARYIEITLIPDILRSQASDIRDALERLEARLAVTS
jgi:HupH hydrogenase expression protein, C-terminal conserved region